MSCVTARHRWLAVAADEWRGAPLGLVTWAEMSPLLVESRAGILACVKINRDQDELKSEYKYPGLFASIRKAATPLFDTPSSIQALSTSLSKAKAAPESP